MNPHSKVAGAGTVDRDADSVAGVSRAHVSEETEVRPPVPDVLCRPWGPLSASPLCPVPPEAGGVDRTSDFLTLHLHLGLGQQGMAGTRRRKERGWVVSSAELLCPRPQHWSGGSVPAAPVPGFWYLLPPLPAALGCLQACPGASASPWFPCAPPAPPVVALVHGSPVLSLTCRLLPAVTLSEMRPASALSLLNIY